MLLQSPVGEEVSKDSVDAVMKIANFFENHGNSVTLLQKDPVDGVAKKDFIISAVETALMFQNIERQLQRPVTRDDMELMTWAIYRSGLIFQEWNTLKWLQVGMVMPSKWGSYTSSMMLLLPTVAQAPKSCSL